MLRFVLLLAVSVTIISGADPTNRVALSAQEEKFRNTVSNSMLNGRWCLIEKGKLTEEYEEKYFIQGVTKSSSDLWLIHARIQYAGRDLTVPIPVRLKWAGDTPVITLDKVSIPGLGAYSARVLIYDKTYAGTWTARDHGGMLHGVIEKNTAAMEKK